MSATRGWGIDAFLHGQISAEVVLARALTQGLSADEIIRTLTTLSDPADERLSALADFAVRRRADLDRTAAMIRECNVLQVQAARGSADVAAMFDAAVSLSPEASVALYSLGDPAILARATAEIVAWLERTRLISRASGVLDLGCGFGRIGAALSATVRSVLCVDVSIRMIEEAKRRYGHLTNVSFRRIGDSGLASVSENGFDLIIGVDSFPYIVRAGDAVAARYVADAARILRPNGVLTLLNLSYRNDPGLDEVDAHRWAGLAGMRVEIAGSTPFRLWDGRAFLFRAANRT